MKEPATLREPESFLHWISTTRSRPGELVRRTDRHVPLHVGGLDRKSGEFVEDISQYYEDLNPKPEEEEGDGKDDKGKGKDKKDDKKKKGSAKKGTKSMPFAPKKKSPKKGTGKR